MESNISYELADDAGSEDSPELTKSGEELWTTKTGHCAEQSYFEKDVLENLGYNCYLIFCKENNSKHDFGEYGSAHVFVIYKKDNKYYYFEHAMAHSRGIHPCNSLKECIELVAKNWWRCNYSAEKDGSITDSFPLADKLEFRILPKEIYGINNVSLAKECYKYPRIAIANISKNRLEESIKTPPHKNISESISYQEISDIN